MAARSLTLATALMLGLTGLARAEAPSTWQDPHPARAAEAPAARTAEARAEPSPAAPVGPETKAGAAPQPKTRPKAERRPSGYRAASYRGGEGARWTEGRDAYGFMGSYGGCRYRGHAGPGGFRLDRSC